MKRRLAVVLFSLVTGGVAHADLTSRAISAATDPDSGSSANSTLLAWAGNVEATSLPDLLQLAIRLSPTLANAKLDIEIAEAQIQQTWARRDRHLTAQTIALYEQSGLISGIAPGSNKRFSVTADITRILPTGGTIGLHAASTYNKAVTDTEQYVTNQ